MAVSSIVQGRVPEDIRLAAMPVIKASGLTVSDLMRVLMTRIALEKEIPNILFKPNKETLKAFEETEEILRLRKMRFKNADELFKELEK